MDFVDLLLRWIHIVSAVTVAGGIIFWRFVLMPAAYSLPETERQQILEATRSRWAKLVMLATAALLVTGLVNAVLIIRANTFGAHPYHTLVLVKLILAMAFFYIAARLSGRSAAAGRFRERLPFWLNITLAIVLGLVLIGGYMKNIPHVPKPGATNALATPAAADQP